MKPTKKLQPVKQIRLFFVATLFTILFVLVMFSPSWAATYYVDATKGNDSNTGTSEATPWKTIAKVNAIHFNPGDNILFNRGDIWRDTLDIPESGAPGRPIIFGAYGSGDKPVISGADDVTGETGDWADQGDNVWRKSIGATGPTVVFFNSNQMGVKDATPDAQYEWTYSDPNLDVYSVGNPTSYYTTVEASQRDQVIRVDSKSYITIDGVKVQGGSVEALDIPGTSHHITVQNCEISNTWWGIHAGGNVTGNIKILKNEIHHTTEAGIAFYTTGTPPSNNLIQGNIIHHAGPGGANTNENCIFAVMDNSAITQNEIYDCGTHEYSDHAIYLAGSNNVEISYNNIYRSYNVGIKVSNSANVDVIYNLLHHNKEGVRIEAGSPQNINVSNNTLYSNDARGYGTGIHVVLGDNIVLKNNIISESDYGAADGKYSIYVHSGVTNFSSDYNLIYHSNGGNVVTYEGVSYTLSGFYSATGNEEHGIFQNPQMVDPANGNFTLQSGSPCLNAGINLGGTYNDGLDPNSFWPNSIIIIDQDDHSTWEIGAYVYKESGAITPPKHLRIVSQ